MGGTVKMRPLTEAEYAKTAFRRKQASLPYPEKVRQVVAMQKRARPVLAARGRVIVPWKLDVDEEAP